jgi:hypothetical protein
MAFKKEGEKVVASEQFTYKMWLTTIDGTKFGTLEICDPAELVEKTNKFYLVLRLERTGADDLSVAEVSEDFVKNAKVTTSEGLAKLVAANLKDPALFGKPETFHKLGADRAEEAKAVLGAFLRGK